MEARSVEEIECHGSILYKANYVEPPESVSYKILMRLFLSKSNQENLESTRIENNEKVFEFNSTNENGPTMLHLASYYGNVDLVINLVSKGTNIHKKDEICGRLAVHMSAMQGNISVMEYFLNNEISVNETDGNGWTLLHYSVWWGNVLAILYLIRKGSTIDVKYKCLGKTPLMVGAEEGHTKAVKVLLKNSALIDEVDDFGRTPLLYSSMTGFVETTNFLISKGANTTITNKCGLNPLHVAAFCDNKDIIECLVSKDLMIDVRDHVGSTPLYLAASEGLLISVCSLVNNGANINILNNNGETPLDCGKCHKDVASYLSAKMINLFFSQGNLNDAVQVCSELLNNQRDQLGSDQIETLDIICKLAKMYEHGQYGEALDILNNVDLKSCFASNDYIFRTKCELQLFLHETQCNFKDSVEGLKCILKKLKDDVLDADKNGSLTVECELALVHCYKREYDETFNVLRNALGIKKESSATESSDTV